MPSNYPEGSVWRRWDLHVHSNASPESTLVPEEIISKMKEKGISMFAVTDHSCVDHIDKFWDLVDQEENLYFLPGVELKTDKGDKSVHLTGIFPEYDKNNHRITTAYLKENFLSKIDCTETKLIDIGKDKLGSGKTDKEYRIRGLIEITVSFEKAAEEIRRIGGICIVHAGSKSRSIEEEMNHERSEEEHALLNSLGHLKETLMKEYIDVCELPNFNSSSLKQRDFYLKQFNKPSIVSSDSHKLSDIGEKFTWIKADPTFEGLRQILYEPEARVHLGNTIPDTRDENRIIKSLHFENSNGWFADIKFPINPALVSVIGGKGSGKTALLDLTAFATGSWKENKASFLYKAHKELIGTEITVEWLGGSPDNKKIEKNLLPGKENKVRYLSQQFVEQLCSEDRVGLELVNEIENVIFEYLDDTEKLGETSFADLRATKTERIAEQKIRLRSAITKLIEEILHLNHELRSLPSKEQRIDELTKEKEGLKKQIPLFDTKEEQEIEEELAKLRDLRKEIVERISERKQIVEFIVKVRDRVESFKEDMDKFYEQLKSDLAYIGIEDNAVGNFEPLFKGDIITPLNQRDDQLKREIKEISGFDTDAYPEKSTHKSIDKRIAELEAKSTADQAKKQKSIEIQKRIQTIDAEIEKLNKTIEDIKSNKTGQLKNKSADRWGKYLSYFDNLKEEQEILEDLYSSLSRTLGSGNKEERSLEFYIKWEANISDWAKKGESLLNHRKKGAYRVIGDLAAKAKETIEQCWITGEKESIEKALRALRETFDDENEGYNLQSQLLDGISEAQFDDWLYSTEHIKLNYGIKYDGLELEKLTPGVKGIVLLILYLEMDKNDRRPLLIDQPEENLDNQSVYKVLTGYFKKAKNRRQIILITHNPNLVVNTDSEQVIVASFEKTPPSGEPKITYSLGSLEDTRKDATGQDIGTRERVCEILEGGETAFHMREKKYAFIRA